MVEVATLETLSPKELGKHLREVRRRKGLSLSEVARGAGLTRRELNAYEKGRTAIPDSDLFVLAGSCGVDVAELRVPTTATELEAAPSFGTALVPASSVPPPSSTIEDMVAQLRRGQIVEAPIVPDAPEAPEAPTVSSRRRPRALGVADEALPEPPKSEWLAQIDPLEGVQWPGDASISSPSTSAPHAPALSIDVFEELARLADPAPSPTDDAEPVYSEPVYSEPVYSDALYSSDPVGPDPFGRYAPLPLTPAAEADADGGDSQPFDQWPILEPDATLAPLDISDSEPVLVEMPPDAISDVTSASDAPPIDVAMRGESFTSPWDSFAGAQR